MLRLIAATFGLGFLAVPPAHSEILWHWEDRFSTAEKAKLTRWITETVAGIEEFVAPYPFDLHIRFHRSNRVDSPVPWANTRRSRRQGVDFHVDPDRTLAELFDDWTAPHELSHLLLPYVGRSNAWFAEGFASYMQFQVMRTMHLIDDEQMRFRYRKRIDKAKRRYDLHELPFVEAAGRLVARRDYPTMYWGGAIYFLQIDRELKRRGSSMAKVLRQFVDCCRLDAGGFSSLVADLDRMAGDPLFSEQLAVVRRRPGFPDDSGIWADAGVERAGSSL